MDFDENRLYFSHQQLQRRANAAEGERNDNEDVDLEDSDNDSADLNAVRRHFREFLSEFEYELCSCDSFW